MATANDLLNCARGEIGYCRYDDPLAGTKYGRWYADLVGNSYYGQSGVAYCAMFVSWCLAQCNISATGFPSAYCPDIVNAAKRAGVNKTARNGVAGDIVLFDWEGDSVSDHVGIIESNNGSYLTTIEGNTTGSDGRSGSVARRTREYSTVVLTFTPNYVEEIPKEWDEMATEAEIKNAVQSVVNDSINNAVTTINTRVGKVAGETWDFNYNGQTMADRVYLCNQMDYDTSDPTDRGKEMTTHDHVKWIAAVEQECKSILEIVTEMLVYIATAVTTKDDDDDSLVDDVTEKLDEVKTLTNKFSC